jgi:serine-type D-Ala-D-Ala carboxypeptidase (penicillin-binding protein 5/6)
VVVRKTRWKQWGFVVVGIFFLSLTLDVRSEAALLSGSNKKHSVTAPKAKTTSTFRTTPQRAPSLKVKASAQRGQRQAKVIKKASRQQRVTARSTRRSLSASRSIKRAQRYTASPQFAMPSNPSFSEASPPLPPSRTFAAALLADARTGEVLFSLNDHREWPAASLTKMMVALLTLEAIGYGDVSLHTPVEISRRASTAGGRSIHLRPGEVFPLEELLQAMMVTSANDAAVALAEHLKGSVEACVAAMNQRARQLGMPDTVFQTPNGLPLNDGTPPDISTAADLALLGRALAKHPLLLQWTSLNRIPFREGRTSLPNTNHLVGRVLGVDGLKTGFTAKARFNLVTTAQRGPLRLIAVVLGGQSSNLRFHTAENLLEWGFTHFTRMNVTESGKPLGAEVRVEQGSVSTLQPIAAKETSLLIRKNEVDDVRLLFQVPSIIAAPIARDQVIGHVIVRNNDRTVAVIPAVSPWDIPRTQWFPARH